MAARAGARISVSLRCGRARASQIVRGERRRRGPAAPSLLVGGAARARGPAGGALRGGRVPGARRGGQRAVPALQGVVPRAHAAAQQRAVHSAVRALAPERRRRVALEPALAPYLLADGLEHWILWHHPDELAGDAALDGAAEPRSPPSSCAQSCCPNPRPATPCGCRATRSWRSRTCPCCARCRRSRTRTSSFTARAYLPRAATRSRARGARGWNVRRGSTTRLLVQGVNPEQHISPDSSAARAPHLRVKLFGMM